MARYRSDLNYDRDYYPREERVYGERARHEDPYGDRREVESQYRPDYSRDRYGKRAEYVPWEPRYSDARERYREGRRSSLYDVRGDLSPQTPRSYYATPRSRVRCRDIMTRDLVMATRDTTLSEVGVMMKQEDTGVIPVVDYDIPGGNGKEATNETSIDTRHYSRGKLVGLITDRDIVLRAVARDRDCRTMRAEEIMSTEIHSARPNDRVADVIRKMGDKQVRRIPIINEGGYLVGIISMADISRETEEDRELGEALEEISKGPSFWSRIFG